MASKALAPGAAPYGDYMQGKIVEENGEKIFRELCNCVICKVKDLEESEE